MRRVNNSNNTAWKNNEVDLAAAVAADEEGKGTPVGGGGGADAAVANG